MVGWDYTADVVVVGFGAAGAAAAITAAETGVKVIVLEKSGTGGGNTVMSAAFVCPTNREEALRYIMELKRIEKGSVSGEEAKIIAAFVDEAIENVKWIMKLGGEVEPGPILPGYPRQPVGASFPNIIGAESMKRYRVSGEEPRGGASLFKLLAENAKRLGVNVLFNTTAKELIATEGPEVIGVLAEREGRELKIRARRAVILACGGYEYDEELKSQFFHGHQYPAIGAVTNTGDGVRMAMKLGAALWHMGCAAGYPGFKPLDTPYAFPIRMWLPSFIYVDKYANRFMNETNIEAHLSWIPFTYFDPVKLEYPRMPCYVIFDETNREAGPLCPHRAVYGEWSMDNIVEIEKGWIVQASSVDGLAKKIGLDPAQLVKTVEKYNNYCVKGFDEDFGRSGQDLMPIEKPPYYAIKLLPCILNTQGGPKRNEKAQVIHISGKPIKRLYSAGELGSLWGVIYQSAGNIAECLAFGRIAGRNAAAEEPME
jgi:succinate dehydrogenase/fumarate reductase flavoprotein subunit